MMLMRHGLGLSVVVVAVAVGGCATPKAKPTAQEGWIELFNGQDLTGWIPRNPKARNGWFAYKGALYNHPPSTDIYTARRFNDFELHVEFLVPPGGNSGVYLRGRYEVQVLDSFGQPPSKHGCGALYGQVAPSENAAAPAGTWQTYDITLIGKKLTVVHNGKKVLDQVEISGPTGGALDHNVGQPGPIMLQGDHGPIAYRNIRIRPIRRAAAGCCKPCKPASCKRLCSR